ncbi:MAG: aminoglycoside phosphotransferase family protein [Enterobacteriaceae bacterium]|nr:aminoglycoside phosphotransferase family protein [Enterobacteriaceae bacterium]
MDTCFKDLSINQDAIRDVLQTMGLLNAEDALRVSPLTGGVSSNILKINAGERQFCLKQALPKLKVAKEWHAPLERVFAEIDWMQTVAGIAPHSVPHITGIDRTTLCFAMDYLPAEQFHNWKSQLLNGEIDIGFAAQLGNVLGEIHQKTAKNETLAKTFAYDDNFFSLRLDPYLGEIARVHPKYADVILTVLHRTQSTRLALVHGDISPKNILRGPTGPVILDAECAWYGDPAFDLAFCLNHFLLKTVIAGSQEAQQKLMLAFDAMYQRYFDHITWEPVVEYETRVAALLPCLILARVDGKSPAEYLQDQNAHNVRRASCALLERQFRQLKDITSFWRKENGL